jgi:GT2 family glycosyltransferase
MSVKPHVTAAAAPSAEVAEPAVADMSAAVCTRDRTVQLERALDSLFNQKLAPAEILVVDNAPSDDSTRLLVECRFPDACYIREPVRGLDFARNRALYESRHEIVAFLDDDAVADRGWSQSMMAAFDENPRAAACIGRVEALALETEAQRLFEANGGLSRGNERICLPGDARRPLHGFPVPLIAWATRLGIGCSLAVRRSAAVEIGGFDEALGLRPVLPGGDELDVLWRFLVAGYEIVYEPDALAWHEHRRELGAVFDQMVGHQRGLTGFLTKAATQARGRGRLSVLGFLAWRLLKPGVRLGLRLAGKDPLPASVLLRMWWNCWLGLGAYAAARRVARQRLEAARRVS